MSDLLILFALAVAVSLVFHRLRLPSVVGFLVTGVLAGPHGLGLITDLGRVESLAELGVVLLLFTIGLEFSINQLVRLRTFLLSAGSLQVGATLVITALLARIFGQSWSFALFAGMLVSLSSTAIVLRLASERGELDTPASQTALGILVFQDLCIVPMMLVLPILAGETTGAGELLRDLLSAAGFIAAALILSRHVMPRILQVVVATRQREVFILTIALFCLAAAWASSRIGLSLALGAFIAGIVISDSPYAHQALGEILPFREVFNSIFFISVGMLFDVRLVVTAPFVVAGVVLGVIVLKTVITAAVAMALGQTPRIAVTAALTLAQIGEFSFVLAAAGRRHDLIAPPWNQRLIAAAVATMALTPALIAIAPRVAAWIEARLPPHWHGGRTGVFTVPPAAAASEGHVLIVGYGLNGRNLARVLARQRIPFTVVEMNAETVRAERARGVNIIYGDATHAGILRHAGLDRARVVVVAISDAAATRSVVVHARHIDPRVHIVVRTRYVQEVGPLMALGTSEVVPEEFETAVELLARVLRRYELPEEDIDRMAREVRQGGYEIFRGERDGVQG